MSLPADDLLSAYYDGESTPAERAVVEQQLTDHANIRRELSQIGQVSALLKELPRRTLPTEFPQQVLKVIEREMLIPSERSQEDDTDATSVGRLNSSVVRLSAADSSPRRWLVGSVAVLTSAAGLLLMVTMFGSRPEKRTGGAPQLAGEFGHSRSFGGASTPASEIADAGPAPLDQAELPLSKSFSLADSSVAGPGGTPRGAVAAMKTKSSVLPPVAAFDAPRATDSVANLFLNQETLKSAEIGDVVEALQTLDDEIAVVRLTVVDRQQGVDQLQLLFAKNQIDADAAAPVFAKNKSFAAKSADSSKRDETATTNQTEQLMAVYVESNSEHLSAALQELCQKDLVQSFEVEPPISFAELDAPNSENDEKNLAKPKSGKPQTRAFQANTEMLSRLNSQRALRETLNEARQSSVARNDGVATAEDKKSRDKLRRNLAKKSDVTTNAKEVPQSTSRQLTLQVPADALPQQTLQNSQSRARSNNANINQRSLNQNKQNTDTQNDQRPMQVLFVVVNQASTPSNSTPPSDADSKPSVPAKSKANAKDNSAKTSEEGGAA
ncbi:MAG: hypothetical protein NT013_07315 [Planctomycetia bacterium]|nr:hypothetical protein [Planctomycetia bacterium]